MEVIKGEHLSPFMLLPAKPGTCPECAVVHDEDEPHNKQSLCYQYHFFNEHGRWPNWADAMSHCSDEMKVAWTRGLKARGVQDIELTERSQVNDD